MRVLAGPLTVICLFVAACGGSETTRPTPLLTPNPGPIALTEQTVTVKNAWTGAVVPGAELTAGGRRYVTDGAGQVRIVTDTFCLRSDTVAPGFLERSTCVDLEITLWPVADAAEREATRSAAFTNDGLNVSWRETPVELTFSGDLAERADVQEIWKGAAAEIGELTRHRITFAFRPTIGESGVVIASGTSPDSCRFKTGWSFDVAGFCVDAPGDPYSAQRLNVLPHRLTDRAVALRGLLWTVLLKAHSQPGLLNASRPAAELSEFERKTLFMISRRHWTLRWPDADQEARVQPAVAGFSLHD